MEGLGCTWGMPPCSALGVQTRPTAWFSLWRIPGRVAVNHIRGQVLALRPRREVEPWMEMVLAL